MLTLNFILIKTSILHCRAEREYIEVMVNKFKDDFKYINVFILVFDENSKR